MKIIYMGTPDFAVEALEALASSRHEVTAVFTQPDKPKGRGKAMQFTPVKEVALRENIPVYQPKKVRDPEVIQKIRELAPDVLVVVAFGQIIPQLHSASLQNLSETKSFHPISYFQLPALIPGEFLHLGQMHFPFPRHIPDSQDESCK